MKSFHLTFILLLVAALVSAAPALSTNAPAATATATPPRATATPVSTPATVEDSAAGAVDYCKYTSDTDPKDLQRNDVIDGKCRGQKVTVIFARGSEEQESIGAGVGLPFVRALAKELGPQNVAVQGVYKYDGYTYPAILSEAGYPMYGSNSGSEAMAHLIAKWKDTCPESKLILGGYSQGCQVTHKAIGLLRSDSSLASKHLIPDIDGVMQFGDPNLDYQSLESEGIPKSKVFEECHKNDGICHQKPSPTAPTLAAHTTYCKDVGHWAKTLKQKLNL